MNLADLKLGLRGDDAYEVYTLPFNQLYDGDLEAMPALSTEYQEYVVDLNNTISDDTIEYKLASDGSDSGVRVLNKVLGFHLMVGDNVTAKIALSEVSIYKAGTQTVLDNFDRVDVNKGDDNCWWRGSVGSIVPRNVTLNSGASYSVSDEEALSGYANLAVSLKGDFSGLTLTPIVGGVAGTPIAWSACQDSEGNSLIASTWDYKTVVINFANSGISGDVTGVTFASTSKMSIDSMFATNMVSKQADLQYPYVDFANAGVFDSFDNRTQTTLSDDYDASSSDPDIVAANLYYSLSYHNGSMVSVANGALTFDATSLAENDYIQAKEASSAVNGGSYKYLVLAVKGEDGADLSQFRIQGSDSAPTYATNWVSGFGLPIPALDVTNYPYIDANGFVYMIVDMEESGLPVADTLDMYYSGTGKLIVDKIMFANTVAPYDEANAVAIGSSGTVDITDGGYQYYYAGNNGDKLPYIAFTFTGDGTVDLASFRLQNNGVTDWLKDGTLIDPWGNPITDVTLTTSPRTIVIDIVASGFSLDDPDFHAHFGDFGTNNGVITIDSIMGYPAATFTRVLDDSAHEVTYTADGYSYAFGIGAVSDPARYLVLNITGDDTANLESLRIEFGGQTIWANSGLVDPEGNLIGSVVPSSEGTEVVIDMLASGYDIDDMYGDMHFHLGGAGVGGTITFTQVAFMDYSPMSYVNLLLNA